MADDPTKTDDPVDDKSKDDPTPDPDAGAKKALEAERAARREAEKQLKEFQAKLKEIEDKDKSEVDKLREQLAELTKDRDALQANALRAEIAMAKGLTAAQAKRLVGATREELEADADEILEAFPTKGGVTPPPSRKPASDLRGGGEASKEQVDVKSLIDSIPPTA